MKLFSQTLQPFLSKYRFESWVENHRGCEIARTEFEKDSLFLGTYFRVDERKRSSQSIIVAISGADWVGTARDSIFRTSPGHRLIPSLFTAMPEDASRKLKRGDVDP